MKITQIEHLQVFVPETFSHLAINIVCAVTMWLVLEAAQ